MDDKVLDKILATDEMIRYVGVLDGDLNQIMSKARKDEELMMDDDHVVRLDAPIILGFLTKRKQN